MTRFLLIFKIILVLLPDLYIFEAEATQDPQWEIFLDQLHCLLSSYHFQKNTSKFNVKILEDWGFGSRISGININSNNREKFFQTIEKYGLRTSGSKNLRDLNAVLKATLKISPEIICNNGEIIIKGVFLKASDVPDDVHVFCNQKLNIVKIFAVDTFFVDRNLDFRSDNGLVVAVMAQKWVVVENLVIDISGKSNETMKNYTNAGWYIEAAGKKGKHGGTFYGLGDELVGHKLKVISNGEDGRDGNMYPGCWRNCVNDKGGDGGDAGVIKMFEALKDVKIESRGGRGGDGGFSLKKCQAKPGEFGSSNASYVNSTEATKIFNSYKAFLSQKYLNHPIMSEKIYSFIVKIDGNPEINNLYRLSDLVEEFEGMEPLTSEDPTKSAYLYKSLLKKIGNYKWLSDEEKTVRLFLYTTVLSYICRLEEDSERGLITDLKAYLDIVMQHVQNVEDAGDIVIIDGLVNNYREDFDQKILEAKRLMHEHIQPKIKKIIAKLNQEIDELVSEIDRLISAAEADKAKLESKKRELELKMMERAALGIIGGLLSGILSYFCPVGSIISDAITTTMIEALDTDIDTGYESSQYDFPKLTKDSFKLLGDLKKGQSTCSSRQKRQTLLSFNNYKNDKDKLNILNEQIGRVSGQIANLKNMRNGVCEVLKPVLKAITGDVEALHENLKNKSETYLAVREWEVQSGLKKVKTIIESQFRGLQTKNQIVILLQELMDSVDIIIRVFDNIQKYQQQQQLGSLIGHVRSAKFLDVKITDENLKQFVHKFDLRFKSNIVLLEYKRFSNAIRQYSFPLAYNYFKQFQIPIELRINETVEDLTRRAVHKMKSFQEKLEKSQISIVKFDDIKHSDVSFGIENETKPFFVWNKKQYGREITDLLNGKEVVLRADPCFHETEAIKFTEIGLKLISKEAINLQKFFVVMTHTGISYYKCGNRTFTISSNVTSIEYKQKLNGNLIDRNEVYWKLKNGDFLLSPFTTWRVKLQGGNFKELKKFVGKVDLELVGVGQYYNPNSELCSQHLEMYYRKVESGISACGFGEGERYVLGHRKCRLVDLPSVKMDENDDVMIY